MAAGNKTQVVLSHDNSIVVSNDQQLPVTSAHSLQWRHLSDYRLILH